MFLVKRVKNILSRKKQPIQAKPTYLYYRNIDSCPWWNFAKVIETDDQRYLIKLELYDELPENKPDENIWAEIMMQYFELSDGQKAKHYINDLSYIIRLRREYHIISDACFVLCYKNDEELINIIENQIKKFDSKYIFNRDEKYYWDSIILAEKKAKELAARIELKVKEFEGKYGKKKNAAKFDGYKVINDLQKYYKLIIDPRTITVRQVLTMNREMVTELKARKHGKR